MDAQLWSFTATFIADYFLRQDLKVVKTPMLTRPSREIAANNSGRKIPSLAKALLVYILYGDYQCNVI